MLRRMDLTRMNDRREKSFQIVSTKRAAMDVMSTDGTSTAMLPDVEVVQQRTQTSSASAQGRSRRELCGGANHVSRV